VTAPSPRRRTPARSTRPTFDEEVRRILGRAEEARQGRRREAGVLHPLGQKAARTRNALLSGAYEAFVRVGYRATTVEDIHGAAGVSLGTFYQYFRDKADVITTLVADQIIESSEHLFHPGRVRATVEGAVHTVEPYIRHYAATAGFQRVWEEATHIEPEVRSIRSDVTALIDEALRLGITRGQRAGEIHRSLDAAETARALNAMVDAYCYRTFVVTEASGADVVESVIRTVATIWSRVLAAG
jgi:AcrR family transcriptional regulator